ncbi:unnamed protein product, partial [Symbiodinium microadriaticum]
MGAATHVSALHRHFQASLACRFEAWRHGNASRATCRQFLSAIFGARAPLPQFAGQLCQWGGACAIRPRGECSYQGDAFVKQLHYPLSRAIFLHVEARRHRVHAPGRCVAIGPGVRDVRILSAIEPSDSQLTEPLATASPGTAYESPQ